jgi:hypothetical protein
MPPRKKKQMEEETWPQKPETPPEEETGTSTERVVYGESFEKVWSLEPEEESVEGAAYEEPLPKLYPVQIKYGLERWQDISVVVELLGTRAIEVDNHIATATATVRSGWRFFESDGVMFKLREADWQSLLA